MLFQNQVISSGWQREATAQPPISDPESPALGLKTYIGPLQTSCLGNIGPLQTSMRKDQRPATDFGRANENTCENM